MTTITSRTHIGGRDLYFGVPDLNGALLVSVDGFEDTDDYCTELNFLLKNGTDFKLLIRQEK